MKQRKCSQQYNKYLKLAKEASSSGDRIQSEYYYQFTDHYYRLMVEMGINIEDGDLNLESKSQDINLESKKEELDKSMKLSRMIQALIWMKKMRVWNRLNQFLLLLNPAKKREQEGLLNKLFKSKFK